MGFVCGSQMRSSQSEESELFWLGGGIKFRGFLLTVSTTPDIPSACPYTQCNPV